MAEFPDVRELIPHRDPVLMLGEVLAHDGKATSVSVDVGSRQWLTNRDGSVSSWIALEYMAQAIAVHEGLLERAEGRRPPRGFLLSTRDLRLDCARFASHEALCVTAQRVRGRPGLGVLSHACEVRIAAGERRGRIVARGRISVSVASGPAQAS